MIFFSGHGILIPVFAVIGFFVGSIAAAAAVAMMNLSLAWSPVGGAWASALCVLLYAKTIGKTVDNTYLDPATGRPAVYRKRHTFFFIPAFAWAVLGMIGAAFISVGALVAPKDGFDLGSSSKSAEEALFDSANRKITTNNEGVAHGNSPEAEKLAAEFSSKLKSLRDVGIEPSKKRSVSLSGGEFITFCHLAEDTCAFLVHVPELRKYTDEAKEFMGEAAWGVAQHCVATLPDKPEKVAVGVRGIALYDRVLTGPGTADETTAPEVHKGANSKDVLFTYFEVKEPKSAEASNQRPTAAAATDKAPEPTAPTAPTSTPPAAATEMTPPEAPTPAPAPAVAPAPSPAPASTAAALPTPVKDWKSADGRVLSASLEGFANAATARFKRAADGVVFEVPVEKFDPATQAEINALFPKGQ
ncbi:hypothetical protein [Verrucomicrobium sp. BvORR034]|uniref:hypothetical protein n=1 Tax=Verrucomicrobium sp. BvORR034 TaxID=1396418 RepID=UPI0006797ED1|nr:hypothetical protein [Verrucomicrobium sp. BvORR034]